MIKLKRSRCSKPAGSSRPSETRPGRPRSSQQVPCGTEGDRRCQTGNESVEGGGASSPVAAEGPVLSNLLSPNES